ncbi:MAG TPA: GWxTD domain-containing protein [Candidatus Desulfaltia sp.]|nr:GWxTD domain-containing protein [Candidatus Desulfaltia sp.]
MVVRRSFLIFYAVLLMAVAALPAGPQSSQLEKKHETWLKDEVNYLITDEEEELFLSLKTDGERNAFINAFWARRDPLALTPANEFKDEHYRRLAEAKVKYGIHTDRGRIYVLLGPPDTIDNETSGKIVFPCEVWNYTNLSVPGFPNSLRLLFFKQWGVGQFRLYSPLFDGLEYLVPQRHYDFRQGDDSQIRKLIRSYMGIDFLMATQSVTPGTDKLESERILATLRDPGAFEALRPSVKPRVTTTVSYEKLPFDVEGFFSDDGHGNIYYDAVLNVSPENLTFEKAGEKHYGREDVYVTIRDAERNVVAQFNEQLSLELAEDEMEAKKGYRLGYAFSQLLIPGEYTVNILLRDYVSSRVGEKDLRLSLPAAGRSTPLLLAGRIESLPPGAAEAAGKTPFTFGRSKVTPKAKAVFGPDESIYLYYEIYRRAADSGDYRVEYAIRDARNNRVRTDGETLTLPAGERFLPVEKVFSPKGLAEGAYTLSVSVTDARIQTTLLEQSAGFVLSSAPQPPGAFSFEQPYNPSPAEMYTQLGRQALFRKDYPRARQFFGLALNFAPNHLAAKIQMARCHALEGNDGPALELLLPLEEDESAGGEVFTILGSIFYGKRDLERTARYLERAAELRIESIEVLNFLGSVYLEMGRKEKARETLARSLLIKDDQPLVKSLLERLDK